MKCALLVSRRTRSLHTRILVHSGDAQDCKEPGHLVFVLVLYYEPPPYWTGVLASLLSTDRSADVLTTTSFPPASVKALSQESLEGKMACTLQLLEWRPGPGRILIPITILNVMLQNKGELQFVHR